MSYGFIDFLASYGIYILLLLINFGLSFIAASIAGKKGFSFGGFLCLGIFVAFWLSLIIAAALVPRAGSRYLEKINQLQRQYAQPQQAGAAFCTGCGAPIESGMSFCPTCGKKDPVASPTW